MRRALIGLAVTTFTVLALAGPASPAPGQVTSVRLQGTDAVAFWSTISATSSTNTSVAVSTTQGSELVVDQFIVNLDASGNITGATDTSADVTSGFSFAIDQGRLSSASTSASGLPAMTCLFDTTLTEIGCSSTTINVAATWTGQGPILRVVSNARSKSDGFSVTFHFNGTDRAATATGTFAGATLGTSESQLTLLGSTKQSTITRCIGLSC
jgi:hypothetical protein